MSAVGVPAPSGSDPARRLALVDHRRALWPDRAAVAEWRQSGRFVWLDVEAPTPDDAQFLQDAFGFHVLALEDALEAGQRAKAEVHPDHVVLVVYAAHYDASRRPGARLGLRPLHLFVGDGFLVTVRPCPLAEVAETVARVEAPGSRVEARAGAVAHALLDAVVDGYPVALDAFADEIDAVEDQMFKAGGERVFERVFGLKKDLLRFRRHVAPARDVLNVLLRRDHAAFTPADEPYLLDLYDHAVRATEALDQYRDLLTGALDAHLAFESNRLGRTVKLLTVASIVLMTNALVAAVYGMNFRHMPELDWVWGYPFALALMVALSTLLIVMFKRRGWL